MSAAGGNERRRAGGSTLFAMVVVSRAPASAVESQFFLASQVHPAPGLDTVTCATRIRGPLDPARLGAALAAVRSRHEALTTRFLTDRGAIVREVLDGPAPELEVVHAASTDEALAEAAETVRRSVTPEARPWRALLLRHDAEDHTLVFAAHRCIWDERSTRLLGRELSGAAQATAARASGPGEVDADLAAGASFFADTLRDVPAVHAFPLQVPRRRALQVDAAEVGAALDLATAERLARAAERWGTSPFVVAAAAAVYVLARYCAQEKVAVGMPFAAGASAREGRLGSGTAILPLGLDANAPTFEALVRAVAVRVERAAAHGATPFHLVAEACGARTDPAANPLFQAACVEDAELLLTLDGCECTPRPLPPPPQQLDLFLRLTPSALRLAYASRLVSHDLAASFCRSWAAVLDAGLREPGRALSELPLLGAEDRAALLRGPNETDRPAFLADDLHALVTRRFAEQASRPAVVCRGRAVSYGELARSAEAIASRLGGAPGLVGVCLPRSPEMVAAMLAVLRGGGAYVPLDPAFPTQRLAYMVEHSRLSRIVTTRALRPMFDGCAAEVIALDDGEERAAAQPPPPAEASPDAPAYVIYTSGSTGRPKGVAVPRVAVASFLASILERPGLRAEDVLCAVTTLSFDIAVLELLAPLCAGGTVVIATEEEARDPRLLAELLRAHHVTVLQATPVTWQMLLAAGWPGDSALTALCGGEALTPSLAKQLAPRVRALWNMYGPTETTVWSTCQRVDDPDAPISVGTPIHNTTVYVLDEHLRPLPRGVEGRLFIGGAGVALGYVHDDELTARRFLPDPFRGAGRMYDTGDRAVQDARGALTVVGRTDFQVKLRGFRIELGEIEARLSTLPALEQVVCAVRRDDPASPELCAYYTLRTGGAEPAVAELRAHCAEALPAHMIPSRFVRLEAVPRTLNGKIDRAALPAPSAAPGAAEPPPPPAVPRSALEREVADVWCAVLSLPAVGVHDNFFELGGTSLAAFSVAQRVGERLGVTLPVLRVFEHPTVAALARHLEGDQADSSLVRQAQEHARARRRAATSDTAFDVAIVGMAGRFPGARDLDQLWTNLGEGRETVTFFRREELDPLVPARDREDPSYVPARGVLEDVDRFDAAFFGITPNEAELMDPQLRVFMEVAWEAFENAGWVGEAIRGPVGVWAGMGNNFYYHFDVLTRPDKLAVMGEIAAEIANEKDHIAPRISHKLNLTGPSLSVHTACSTTLVVVENAYEALVTRQVDVALAGGVDIRTPQRSGQRYEEGGVFSIDGHCRPFDAKATGTMFGEGVGAVVLKRLDDALRDGDTIHAVIKGAAVNHDGGHKVGYLAPSVEGQARVIASALALAGVDPDTITMLEAHGTGTPIGDPIEVEALTRVYRTFTQRRRYCALGSIKGNFGHATTAAGIAGLLKVVLSMKHRAIPPTLHYATPNPRIDFEASPFFVADRLLPWSPPGPRRAGVSSFGFCGTNAHVVLEEAPETAPSSPPARPAQLFVLSARDPKALEASAERLASALQGATDADLADAAFTTQVGRKRFAHRRCAVVRSAGEAAKALREAAGGASASLRSDVDDPPVAFVFPGQGSQYVNMGLHLYRGEPHFRDAVDACAATLAPHLGCDLRDFLFPRPADVETARRSLNDTFYTQPAIFTIGYALASLVQRWGVRPSAFIGHSIGEFVGATLAGVMERDDALRLVAARGRLMQALPGGSMLTVRLPVEELLERLPAGVDLAAVNAPRLCVVAGPSERIDRFAEELAAAGVSCRKLHTSHAFHSSMMDPVVEPFLRTVEGVRLSPPRLPVVSTVTGDWMTAAEATSPAYWARHLRSPVRFSTALERLLEDPQRVLLECGPRRTSTTLALQHRPKNPDRVVATLPDSGDPDDEVASLLLGVGALWLNGCRLDWPAFHESERRRRRPLPTYPFQRKRFWIEPGNTAAFGLDGVVAPRVEACAAPEAAEGPGAPAAAGDEITRTLVAAIEELLGQHVDDFDEDARFIALGLDSLLLTQLARAVRARLGFEVTFRQLTERYPTTRLLADAIRAARPAGPAPAPKAPSAQAARSAPQPRAAGRVVLSPTPVQQEAWRGAAQGAGERCTYNQSLVVELAGAVDDAALTGALRALPTLHEALRGRFAADGRFVVEPALEPTIAHHDLSALPADARDVAVRRILDEDAATPFDLATGPLLRAAVIALEPTRHVLLLGAHEAACDGWSLDVLLADVAREYSHLAGSGPGVAPPEHQLRDYVALRETPAYTARIDASRAFWRAAFTAAPARLDLAGDGPHAPAPALAVHRVVAPASEGALRVLRPFTRAHGVSLAAVVTSALAAVLHRLAGADDLVVGAQVAGHPDAAMDDVVGPLVSVVPVRVRFGVLEPFKDLCRATSAALLDGREHAALGLAEIAADLGLPAPLASVVVTHVQRLSPDKLTFAGCSADYHHGARAFGRYDLELTVVEAPGSLRLELHGRRDRFSAAWLRAVLLEVDRVLQCGCDARDVSVAALLRRTAQAAASQAAGATPVEPERAHPAGPGRIVAEIWEELAGPGRFDVRDALSAVGEQSRVVARALEHAVRDRLGTPLARYKLRACAEVGEGTRVLGRVWVHGEGRIVLGARVLLDATRAPIELHAGPGAELVIGDDVVVEGGASIDAARAVTIGARSRVGAYCKIMDSHLHDLEARGERPVARTVVVDEGAELRAHAILTAGARVGAGAIIEENSVVGRAIAAHAVARGVPAVTCEESAREGEAHVV